MTDNFFPFPVKVTIRSLFIPAGALAKGIPLGQGKCLAVRMYLNSLVNNTQTATATAANLRQIYYGDSDNQPIELIAGTYTHLLYCQDLQDIFVRCNGIANTVQIIIYERVDAE